MLGSYYFHSSLSARECRERLKESMVYDYENSDGRFRVSHWTFAKGGPLVRGFVGFSPASEGSQVQLDVVPNYYRLLGPLGTVFAIIATLVYSMGPAVLEATFLIWVLPIGALTLVSAAFVPWARKKLLAEVKSALSQETPNAEGAIRGLRVLTPSGEFLEASD